nr:PREDICTED: golgin subfamily A member 6-like protein 22 [Anolis carolinensis]|eukprot:XP_016848417.1 PREDICTED: golgin subfamily A member 6-like protein 22 [Anolis carolinensis]
MSTQKLKIEEKKATGRKGSFSDEINLKDVMRELQKITESQKNLQEQMIDMRKELSEEFIEVKKEIKDLQREMKEVKEDKQKMEKNQDKLQARLDKLEAKNIRLEERQEKLEMKELEFQVRIRNIIEEPKENLKQITTQILADLLQVQDDEMEDSIERAYRVTTNYSKKHKVARDVVVQFDKKKIREEVLRTSKKNTIRYKGQKVTILKEHPASTMQKRKKYTFLTEELKRRHIRFRWERKEGIMATYNNERIWLTSEEKAKEFYMNLMKKEIGPNPPVLDLERERKRARTISPEKVQQVTTLRTPNLINLEEEEEEERGPSQNQN